MLDQQERDQLIDELQELGAILGGAETDSELMALLDLLQNFNRDLATLRLS